MAKNKPRKKKLTPNQQEWKKEIGRIKRFISQKEKEGFRFDFSIPETPERITKKKLELIKSVKPSYLYEHGRYIKRDKTEITAEEYLEQRKEYLAQKRKAKNVLKKQKKSNKKYNPPKFTDVVLSMVESMIEAWVPPPNWSKNFVIIKTQDKNTLDSMLKGAINLYGRDVVALRLEENAEVVIYIANDVLYESGSEYYATGREGIQADLLRFAEILKGSTLNVSEAIDLTEEMEDDEIWE